MSGVRDNNGLTARQLTVIELLASGATVTDSARAAKVDRTTISSRWMKDPTFAQTLEERRAEVIGTFAGKVISLLTTALDMAAAALEAGDLQMAQQLLRFLPNDLLMRFAAGGLAPKTEVSVEADVRGQVDALIHLVQEHVPEDKWTTFVEEFERRREVQMGGSR